MSERQLLRCALESESDEVLIEVTEQNLRDGFRRLCALDCFFSSSSLRIVDSVVHELEHSNDLLALLDVHKRQVRDEEVEGSGAARGR